MKTLNLLFVILIAGIIASSCTVKQTINYNEDMSGTQTFSIDMSDMMTQLAFMQEEGEESIFKKEDFEGAFDDLKDGIEDNKGISNFKSLFNEKEESFGFQFDFKDTKALNQFFKQKTTDENVKQNKNTGYILKKKSLSINYEEYNLSELFGEDNEENQEMASMMGMMDMFTFETEINFPFKVKSVNNSHYTLSADKKTVSSSFTFDELTKTRKDANVKIVW
ncbi:MAG: hypothetical protein LRY27_02665 [Chitinophagales bacterium]|nr:hypothetical protein [Chitinophagales bacterium]